MDHNPATPDQQSSSALVNKYASTPKAIQRTYLGLLLGNTLAASLIWGINTIFLLDAGLSNLEAFAANAFFTAGMVLFEIPTGVIADTLGRRYSYLLGTATLMISTFLYVGLWQINGPFWSWAIASVFLGLGFTFFSGAVEAWLVDALNATGYEGTLEAIFGKGQMVTGAAMLIGSVGGGLIAQVTNLGIPFVIRSIILGIVFIAAFFLMRDIGFTPKRTKHPTKDMKQILTISVNYGLRDPKLRWVMLAAPFVGGISIYAFYALQPYILEMYGDEQAYVIAGLAAAAVAGAQIAGGFAAPYLRQLFRYRTSALLAAVITSGTLLILVGLVHNLWVVLILVVMWGLVFAASSPIRQAYINSLIPSQQRATIISMGSLMDSTGGVVIQPVLGRAADVWSYGPSFLLSGVINLFAAPFLLLARREQVAGESAEKPVLEEAKN